MKLKLRFTATALIIVMVLIMPMSASAGFFEEKSDCHNSHDNIDIKTVISDDSSIKNPEIAISMDNKCESIKSLEGEEPEGIYGHETCIHSPWYDFDDENRVVGRLCEGDSIAQLIEDIASYPFGYFENDVWIPLSHYAIVLDDGVEINEGIFHEGMVIQIYHGDELYSEYTVDYLIPSYSYTGEKTNQIIQENTLGISMASSVSSELIMPIDNIEYKSPYIYREYSSFHPAVDFQRPKGANIRAVQGGTVWKQTYNPAIGHYDENGNLNMNSYGNCVIISHPNSVTDKNGEVYYPVSTLYAHLKDPSSIAATVNQGDIIGVMGGTGEVTGVHLHFEVRSGTKKLNPRNFLEGAPTYSGPDTHTCTYEYVWPEGTHPHVNHEQCTICGDLRSMGTNAATYEYTYYLTDHPHRQYGMCNMCHIEKFTGEYKTCNQVAIYPDGDHPHRRYRKYACGATEYLDSYGECKQVAIYVSEDHPHRRYRVYACGATEWLDSFGECNQVAIYPGDSHPHRRYRVYACGATEWLDSFGECNQVAIYPDGDHPHRRYRKYACGATEWLDSFDECNQVAIYADGDHPHRRYRVYACGATEYLDSYMECKQVAIYTSETHPHRRYRVYACGADEWLDSYGECTCK